MTLHERIRKLASEKEITIPQLENTLGLGSGTISRWKTSSPSIDKLLKIAQYFHVSLDYLTERDDSYTPVLSKADETDIARDLELIIKKLNGGNGRLASFDGKDIPQEDRELFAGQLELMLRRLKPINKEKYNPHKNGK